eukprot:m.26994 g.26994  ORF g.26994 m.26994 type:complete len:482 (+) comp7852_c0_seq1:121-1566(+)
MSSVVLNRALDDIRYAARHLSNSEREQLLSKVRSYYKSFQKYDTDGSGFLEMRNLELQRAMNDLGLRFTRMELLQLLDRFDSGSDKRIGFLEFSAIMMELLEKDPKIVSLSQAMQSSHTWTPTPIPAKVPERAGRVKSIFNTPPSDKKFALCIGVGYVDHPDPRQRGLMGTIDDADALSKFLIAKCGFDSKHVAVMTDGSSRRKPRGWVGEPTRRNILSAFHGMIRRAENLEVTEVFFSYSGHGMFIPDVNGDEVGEFGTGRGRDETIVPSDYYRAGIITDDELAAGLRRIPQSCKVFILMDCCYSASNCDLVHEYGVYNQSMRVRTGGVHMGANIVKLAASLDTQKAVGTRAFGDSGWLTSRFMGTLLKANMELTYRQLVHCIEARKTRDVKAGDLGTKKDKEAGVAAQIAVLAMSKPELLDVACCGNPKSPELLKDFWGEEDAGYFQRMWESFTEELDGERDWDDKVDDFYDDDNCSIS